MAPAPTSSTPRLLVTATVSLMIIGLAVAWASGGPPPGSRADAEAPAYSPAGQLLRPSDYREWIFVTSGLGMTYGPAKAAEGQPTRFDNVFVTRAAHREFLRSGTWPDGTMFVLEVRRAEANVSINKGGQTQGDVVAIEAAVKDRGRFPGGGWAYFTFDSEEGLKEAAPPLPATATCYSCHREKAAVDNTFVQFYPTLLDVARRHKTVGPGHDPKQKP
jgi:hypothetical protein